MTSDVIRQKFLDFYKKRGHTILPSASLIPENDPSVLFNTAGMQPLVPYLLGEDHPAGARLADVQKCVRTGDLEDIGDNRHLSFFEMMGNWSLGDYFKKEAIGWSYEFLTSKEEGLGLDPNRLYVTCFEGDTNAPRDEESADIWISLGIPKNRIYFLGADDNWWSPGDNGPCGPDTEMFYDLTTDGLGDLSPEEFASATAREDIIEIWNDVFMEYEKKDGQVIGKLAKKNVDTGAGLERMTAVMQGKTTAYDTDLFSELIIFASTLTDDKRGQRIIADHFRTAVFMIADGVLPSNTDRGYILRRLIRRAIMKTTGRELFGDKIVVLADAVINKYKTQYPELADQSDLIVKTIESEALKFQKTIKDGLKEFEKGTDPFVLFTTYGFPIELTEELAKEKGQTIDRPDFDKKMKEHQKLSQTSSAGMFKGGLGGHSEQIIRYHTATHLLHQALHDVLGDEVSQKGSNITDDRLRFDFSFSRKLTDDEKAKVEQIVNQKIADGLPVNSVVLPKNEAEATGARHSFGDKYGEMVTIYFIGADLTSAYSKEFCGGPHVKNTSELGQFKIQKEEAVAQGIRRIKATLY